MNKKSKVATINYYQELLPVIISAVFGWLIFYIFKITFFKLYIVIISHSYVISRFVDYEYDILFGASLFACMMPGMLIHRLFNQNYRLSLLIATGGVLFFSSPFILDLTDRNFYSAKFTTSLFIVILVVSCLVWYLFYHSQLSDKRRVRVIVVVSLLFGGLGLVWRQQIIRFQTQKILIASINSKPAIEESTGYNIYIPDYTNGATFQNAYLDKDAISGVTYANAEYSKGPPGSATLLDINSYSKSSMVYDPPLNCGNYDLADHSGNVYPCVKIGILKSGYSIYLYDMEKEYSRLYYYAQLDDKTLVVVSDDFSDTAAQSSDQIIKLFDSLRITNSRDFLKLTEHPAH